MNSKTNLFDFIADHKCAILVALFGTLIASLLGWGQYREYLDGVATEQRDAEIAAYRAEKVEQARLREAWGVIDKPNPLPQIGNPPNFSSDLPPVEIMPDGSKEIGERLRFLVDQNPNEWARLFGKDIEAGKLLVNFQVGTGFIGQFAYYPRDMIMAGAPSSDAQGFPTLVVDPVMIEKMASQQEVLGAMLVIEHEFIHYQQWMNANPDVKADFQPKRQGQKLFTASCERLWAHEREAYLAECKDALAWGVPEANTGDMCYFVGNEDRGFDRYLFALMKEGMLNSSTATCVASWAKLAGHPRWELYK
ncbi:MAG: hypothetical protein WCT24_01925 [Patescibacteria group bacterium]